MKAILLIFSLLAVSTADHHGGKSPVAVARFDMAGIRGAVVFKRNATTLLITSTLTGISISTATMDIRQFPAMFGVVASPCGQLGGVFNPTDKSTPLGSLSARLNFTVQTGVFSYYDPSPLTLVGNSTTSIVGHSLSLGTAGGDPFACATIKLVNNASPGPSDHQCGSSKTNLNRHETLRAVFRGRVSGNVMIRRLVGGMTNDATVQSHLFYTDGTAMSTSGHLFHIHTNPVGAAGSGWPCSMSKVRDVVQGFGSTMSIGNSPSAAEGMQVFNNENTKGFATLAGRALVIHNETDPRIIVACADMFLLKPRKFVANLGNGRTVTLEQNNPLDSTSVITDAGEGVSSISINKYPVKGDGSCGSADVGPEFNPFDQSKPDRGKTPDKYPTGDLTDKLMAGKLGQSKACDNSLPLFGPNSLAGRSVTVRYSKSATVCADLKESTSAGQTMMRAKAIFYTNQGGNVNGTIYLTQYRNADGSLGETTIDTDGITNSDGTPTLNHNYHVHVNRKGFYRNSSACGGDYAGGHFNPARVAYSAQTGSSYDRGCNQMNQLRCELGDTSKKSGQINLNGGRAHRQDEYLPLYGPNTVLGRSFVIHDKNGGAPRYACANIIPATAQDIQIGFKKSRLNGQTFSESDFEKHVNNTATSSGMTAWAMYSRMVGEDSNGCMYMSAAIDGKDAQTVAYNVYKADLGPYTQDALCISFSESVPTPTSSGVDSSFSFSLLSLVLSIAIALYLH